MKKLGLLVVAVLLATSCMKREARVRFRVEAKTNQGDPVSAAIVALDGIELGRTNALGLFEGDTDLPVGARRRLEVKKESAQYYFAPYYETFSVGDAKPLDLDVAATLYFVPKPSANEVAGAKDVGASPTASPTTTTDTGVSASAEAEAKVEAAPPKDEDLTAVLAAEAAKATDVAAEIAAPEGDGAAEELAAEEPAADEPAAPAAIGTIEQSIVNPKPELAAVNLDFVAEQKPAVYPKPHRPDQGAHVFTVHVFAGEAPVAEAQVLLGQDEDGDLKVACTTNARGRCAIRFPEKPEGAVTFVAVKQGFKTKSVTATVDEKQILKIDLERGQTIDIFTVTKAYNFTTGLKDVEIYVNDKRVGVTDRFGRYSHVYEGKADDLITVTLKSKGYLPETYETDFVATGPMKLVRPFTPADPPSVRVAVLMPQPAGAVDAKAAAALQGPLDDAVKSAARKHLFSSAAFKEYPIALLDRASKRIGRGLPQMLRQGWGDTDLKATVDALLLPTIIPGPKPSLELSVVDSAGRVIAAAKEDLDNVNDKASVDRAVAVVAKKITRAFPFEGAVLSKEADKVVINLGYGAGRGVKAGDVLDVYGVVSANKGLVQEQKNIARLVIREVFDTTAKCAVQGLVSRATIERGDLVALRPRRVMEAGGAQIRVSGNLKGSGSDPIPQANVYFNDAWIGATDDQGRLYLDATGTGTIKVIRHGFQPVSKSVALTSQSRLDVSVKRETAFLRVDSVPTGAAVKVEGKLIGKTPLATPIPVPSGFVKVEIEAPGGGYKSYSQVLELDQGTLDLTGANAIQLESDQRTIAQRLLKEGKVEDALAAYEAIPKTHSDYLLARHEAGEIYLNVLDQPAKAAEAFGLVTADEGVKQFMDKRFIGSHVDEGIALFETAEKLGTDQPQAAAAHYKKAIEVLENVVPQLRFVMAEQYAQAVHNVDFHRALARHKLWLMSQDQAGLADTVRTWRSYLDGSARSLPAEGASKAYVENAQVYYRQAQASLGAAKNVSNQ